MLIPDIDGLDDIASAGIDPGSLLGSKAVLKTNGFTENFGDPDTIHEFEKFVNREASDGSYCGKSTEWLGGGRSAILKHKLIVSGKYGNTLNDIDIEDWHKIKTAVRVNYFRRLAEQENVGYE